MAKILTIDMCAARVLLIHLPGEKDTPRDMVKLVGITRLFKESIDPYDELVEEQVRKAQRTQSQDYAEVAGLARADIPDNLVPKWLELQALMREYNTAIEKLDADAEKESVQIELENSDSNFIKDRYEGTKGIRGSRKVMEIHARIMDALDSMTDKPRLLRAVGKEEAGG